MIYDYEYFHKTLLRLKSLNFELYQHITEKDLLIQALCGEEITDYSTINWRWLSEDLYGPEYSDDGQIYSFDINGELEEFIRHIISREETVRILTYLRDHCKECLFNGFYDKDCVEKFETECARLISANIEESKRDQYHGDFRLWPRPNLKEIATPTQKKPEYSIMETAILRAIPKPKNYRCIISNDVLLHVAYEFVDYFRASVKAYNEGNRDEKLKPSMSQKQQGDIIYNMIIRRANRYLYWDRNPVYQVFFILGCLMGMPDHRRSWWEENFAKGIGDYLEKTDNFKGSKEKIQNVIHGLLTLSQYQLDFDMENVEEIMNAQTEQLRQEQEQLESERLLKPEEPKQEARVKLQVNNPQEEPIADSEPDCSFFVIEKNGDREKCKKELLRILRKANSKSKACQEILTSATVGYFNLEDKIDQEKADLINPWAKVAERDFVFTGEDFRKARKAKKKS